MTSVTLYCVSEISNCKLMKHSSPYLHQHLIHLNIYTVDVGVSIIFMVLLLKKSNK
jgi:hypothetical protein